jgi:hypothetical protein
MIVIVIVMMPMAGVGARGACALLVLPGAERHPQRDGDDDHGGADLEVRLGRRGAPLAAIGEREQGHDPHDRGVGDRRRDRQQCGVPEGAADRDDERRHHRLRVARLEAVERPQQDGAGNEQPRSSGALLHELGEGGHGRASLCIL